MAENRVQIVITTDAGGAVTGIQHVRSEMQSLGSSGANAVSSLNSGFASLGGTLRTTLGMVTGFASALAGGIGLAQFTRELVQTATALDTMNNKLRFAVGKEEAARSLQFIREESRRLGLNMMTAADSLGSFAAAARGTSMDTRDVRQVFLAVAEASTVMGLSNEEAKGAMIALTQMMSKGKVQAEELRGQLGERLPGAFQIAARAMGMTTSELDKFMADGKLVASDFLPKFAAQLRQELAGSVQDSSNSTRSELNRLSNAWVDLQQAMLEAGFLSTITKALQELAAGARAGAAAIKNLKESTKDWPIGIFDLLRPGGIPGALGNYAGQWTRETFFPPPPQGPVRRPIQTPEIIGQYKYDPEAAYYAGLKGAQGRATQFLDELGKWAETAKDKTKPAWLELRENLAKTDQALAYGKMTTEQAGYAYKKYWAEYEKSTKPKGGGGGAGPVDVERIDQDVLRFREKMEKLYSELEDLDSEYRSAQLEQSGRYYDAEAERLDRQAQKKKDAFAKEVADAEQAYLEMEQKLQGKRGGTAEAWGQLAELKARWDQTRKAAEEYGNRVDRNLKLTLDMKKAEDDTKRAETLAQLNLEYGKMTGTLQEQLSLQILLLRAEKDRKLLAVDPALREAIERNYAEQERLLTLQRDGSVMDGFIESFRRFQRESATSFSIGEQIFASFERGIDSAADALAEFTMTGKMSFSDFANSVIRDLMKMFYRMMLMKMFGGLFDTLFGGGGGSASAPSWTPSIDIGDIWDRRGAAGGNLSQAATSFYRPSKAGGIVTTVNVNVPAATASTASREQSRALADEIARAVKAEINKNIQEQQRPGGLMNRGIGV